MLDEVVLRTDPGAALFTMQRLACIAALQHNCRAAFTHNDRLYVVDPLALMDLVKKQ